MASSPELIDVEASDQNWLEGQPYTVILFYRYVNIDNVDILRGKLLKLCVALGILGRILIAPEGINGTLAGSITSIETFIQYMSNDERFSQVDWKCTHVEKSTANSLPFLSLSIRETKEIISCGRAREFISSNSQYEEHSFGGLSGTGEHLSPLQFHKVRHWLLGLSNTCHNTHYA